MMKLIREPLLQFMLIGLLFYAAFAVFAPENQRTTDAGTIRVNDEALAVYLQIQDKAFDREGAAKALSSLDAEGRRRLEAEFIRDEIMVREALKLGLDEGDEVIRGRLIQKMDFIMQGFAANEKTVSEADLLTYFTAHKQDYQRGAEATFTHIFFSIKNRSIEEATAEAATLLPILNQTAIAFEKAGEYGERFYFLRNYINRPKRLINDHFGPEMTAQIFAGEPNGKWAGPYQSQYGAHLVMLRNITPARSPELAEVADQVLADIRRARSDEERAKALEKLAEKYTITRDTKAAN